MRMMTVQSPRSQVEVKSPISPYAHPGLWTAVGSVRPIAWAVIVAVAIPFFPVVARYALECHDRVLANVTRVHMEQIGAIGSESVMDRRHMHGIFRNGWGERIYMFRDGDGITVISFARDGNKYLWGRPGREQLVERADFVWKNGTWIRRPDQRTRSLQPTRISHLQCIEE